MSEPRAISIPHVADDAPRADATLNETIIEPRAGWIGLDWRELVRYRELLTFLVWRDVKVKYKQAMLGVAWAVILPLISLAIYGSVAAAAGFRDVLVGSPKPPLILWMFSGLVPWMFLQRSISDGGLALVNNQPLMTKIYLPRLYLPIAACGNALVDMAINVGLLGAIGTFCFVRYGWTPTWQIVFVVPLFALLLVAALGLAFTLSAATVLYRDLRFIIPFLVQFGVWLSTVTYPLAIYDRRNADGSFVIPHHELIKTLYAINPLTGIISGFHSAIAGQPWEWLHLGTSIVLSVTLFVCGLFYFKRVERLFADIA